MKLKNCKCLRIAMKEINCKSLQLLSFTELQQKKKIIRKSIFRKFSVILSVLPNIGHSTEHFEKCPAEYVNYIQLAANNYT